MKQFDDMEAFTHIPVPIETECRIQAGTGINTKSGTATLLRAADEIERLRAEVERLTTKNLEWLSQWNKDQETIAASQAEVVRLTLREKVLREALKHWADSSLEEPSLSLCARHTEQALSQPTDDTKDGHPADLALRNYVADEMVRMVDKRIGYDRLSVDWFRESAERYRKGEV